MARRPPIDLKKLAAEQRLQRALSGTNDPIGVQWFVDMRFAELQWYRDRTRINAIVDGLATTPWFREFDVFAPGAKPGSPFKRIDEVRESIACGEPMTAMFAHGQPRMTVDIHEAEAALALSIIDGRLELRIWCGVRVVAQYKAAILDEVVALLIALRESWPDTFVAVAQLFPDPIDGVRYRRTRPLRTANRALNALVDVIDRDVPSAGPSWARDATAMMDAAVPAGVTRLERGKLVVLRWIDDPSDPQALADACSRHEQWLVDTVETRLAPGWNDDGDLQVFDVPTLVEVTSDLPASGQHSSGGKPLALVASSRSNALALADRARSAGFVGVLYRDASGTLWDPQPPGYWIEDS